MSLMKIEWSWGWWGLRGKDFGYWGMEVSAACEFFCGVCICFYLACFSYNCSYIAKLSLKLSRA
jgi:hypothetical protein